MAQLRKAKPKTAKKRKGRSAIPRQVSNKHPLLPQVKALVQPFDSSPGDAKHLVNPLPSQAYKLKSRATITVPTSAKLVGLVSPSFGDLSNAVKYPSAFFVAGTDAQLGVTILADNGQAGTSHLKTTAGAGALVATVAPVRPYRNDVEGGSWRLVSYAVRLRYTGSALNANGTIKYLPNDLGAMVYDEYPTFSSILNYIDGSNHTIMRSVYDKAVYDFSGLGATDWMHGRETSPAVHDSGDIWGDNALQQAAINHWEPRVIGQDGSTTYLGIPGMLLSYVNNSSAAVQFEVELVENWEARTATNTAFHTDSHANPELSQEVFRTVVSGHMHAASSSAPTVVKSLKTVNAASKSPLGKLVIAAALS